MEYISLSQSAILVNKSKSTVLQFIRDGRLEAKMNEKGIYDIDKKTLFEVFDSSRSERTEKKAQKRTTNETILQGKLDAEIALRIKLLEDERDHLKELLQQAGVERIMLHNRLSMLEETKPINLQPEQSALWRKLFGNRL
jgi:hypothetical protein